MTYDQVSNYYKTALNFSVTTGFGRTTWYDWKRLGYVPIKAQHQIEMLTNGLLKADIHDCVYNQKRK